MKKLERIFICLFLVGLVALFPVSFAYDIKVTEGVTLVKNSDSSANAKQKSVENAFPGLPGWLVLLLAPFVKIILIGAAVIAAGYVVYRIGYAAWVYYTAYLYSKWYDHHSYQKHIVDNYEFENIWGKTKPSQKQFEDKCKQSINSKSSSVLKFIQRSNGRFISYDTVTKMVVVGDTNGKTIVTCYKDTTGELKKQTQGTKPNWVKFK